MKENTTNQKGIYYEESHYRFIAEPDTIKAELEAELAKSDEAKAKNAEAYASIHDLIMDTLSDTPVTCAELYDTISADLPEGVTKGKVQYALTHLWQDEIVKIAGKPNTYRKA